MSNEDLKAELAKARESEMRCREALESAEHTARKQNERIKDKEIARLRQQIAELEREEAPWRKVNNTLYAENTELRETLKQVREILIEGAEVDIIDQALAGASDEKDSKAAKELAVWLLRKDEVDRDMRKQIDSLWERTDIYVDLQEKQREQIDALEKRLYNIRLGD